MTTHGHHCGTGAKRPNTNAAMAAAVTGILIRAASHSHRESPNRVVDIANDCITEAPQRNEPQPKSMPWASGSSLDQLIVTVWRRM